MRGSTVLTFVEVRRDSFLAIVFALQRCRIAEKRFRQ